MASGKEKAQSNYKAFEVWKATQTDDDFKRIVYRSQLNRVEVAKGVGCGKSALSQNPAIRKALKSLENELRIKGVLPSETIKKKSTVAPQNTTTTKRIVSNLTLNECLY